jgi:uncharacterized protein (TIGR02145 family)
MKKILTTLALLVATTVLLAQVPQKFSYQGVIRDAAGNLVRNAPVGVRVSLLKASADGVAVYCETHRQSTNANGLLTLTIGDGTVVGGDMAAIDWADGPYFLKTETDITGGSNYTLVGAQQLLSVPYALYAGTTTNGFSGDYNDLSNKPEIPAAQVNADWKATEGVAEILNKPTKVSAFENDAKYLTEANLAARLDAMQQQIDSLKEQIGEGGGSGQGGNNNDGKPCKGMATITDVDGNTYNTVQIGEQCWMKENLRTTKHTDGTDIENIFAPNGQESNVASYGYLYFWSDAMLGICPIGWHVPSDNEWQELLNYVEYQIETGNIQNSSITKALASSSGWEVSSVSGTPGYVSHTNNVTGFCAFPAGSWHDGYSNFGSRVHFWSTTSLNTDKVYYRWFSYSGTTVNKNEAPTSNCFSVRCLKNEEHTDGEACGTVKDVDGNTYNTVQIGNQCWMKENLRTTKYADRTGIDRGSSTSSTAAYWYYPNNDSSTKDSYGLLYNWKAVMRNASSSSANPSGVQGVCPTGWHVPSEAEWRQLTDYVSGQNKYLCVSGGNNYIAQSLASTLDWEGGNAGCDVGTNPSSNNATGFSALPTGYYEGMDGRYKSFGKSAGFWSSTEYDKDMYDAYVIFIFNSLPDVGYNYTNYDELGGHSVRCLRD